MLDQQCLFDLLPNPKDELSSFDGFFNRILTETQWPEDHSLMSELKIARSFSMLAASVDSDNSFILSSSYGAESTDEESDTDDDLKQACSMRLISQGKVMSIFFFGKKAMEVVRRKNDTIVLNFIKSILPERPAWATAMQERQNANTILLNDISDFSDFYTFIRSIKAYLFRKLSVDPAACCNSYLQCSDQRACIKPHSLTSVSCYYRRNLEKGNVFYGKNSTIDAEG